MIIRDLTLRSAQSFGSFHLIRLLYDEYLLYLVELRLAKAANKPVISIMAQVRQVFSSHLSISVFHYSLIVVFVALNCCRPLFTMQSFVTIICGN